MRVGEGREGGEGREREGQEGGDTGREQCGFGCYSWTKSLSSQYTPDFIVVCE